MEPLLKDLSGENSVSKVIGLYTDPRDAQAAARKVLALPGMDSNQVRLLGPEDAENAHHGILGRGLKPAQRSLVQTIAHTPVALGVAGASLGALLFWRFMRNEWPLVTGSPWLAALALVMCGGIFGLLLGSALSLPADHVQLIDSVHSALANGGWALVLHPSSTEQTNAVKDFLLASGAQVLSTP